MRRVDPSRDQNGYHVSLFQYRALRKLQSLLPHTRIVETSGNYPWYRRFRRTLGLQRTFFRGDFLHELVHAYNHQKTTGIPFKIWQDEGMSSAVEFIDVWMTEVLKVEALLTEMTGNNDPVDCPKVVQEAQRLWRGVWGSRYEPALGQKAIYGDEGAARSLTQGDF